MLKSEFDQMTLDEVIGWASENLDDLTTEESLLEYTKTKIDENSLFMALHILNAVYNGKESYNGYYLYDYNMGTLETPTSITCKEDLIHLIDFDDE